MTDRSPDSDHSPRPAEVRRSLRALADGSVSPRESAGGSATVDDADTTPESVVADATPNSVVADTNPESVVADTNPESVVADTNPESVVADAESAVDCAREAATFLSDGRLPTLDRAVAAAARRGDHDVACRGRAARKSLRRLDAALNGSGTWESPTGSEPRPRDDHFHSGRGTVLGDTAQGRDR